MNAVEGYILRISTRQWADRVFGMAIYFTNMSRKWRTGQTVLFMRKTSEGDAFVGYGLIEKHLGREELSGEDRRDCEEGSWKRARFSLGKDELDSILFQAEAC